MKMRSINKAIGDRKNVIDSLNVGTNSIIVRNIDHQPCVPLDLALRRIGSNHVINFSVNHLEISTSQQPIVSYSGQVPVTTPASATHWQSKSEA